MAMCGGVSCIMEPVLFVALSKAKMISPEGTSKPFTSRADRQEAGVRVQLTVTQTDAKTRMNDSE